MRAAPSQAHEALSELLHLVLLDMLVEEKRCVVAIVPGECRFQLVAAVSIMPSRDSADEIEGYELVALVPSVMVRSRSLVAPRDKP